MQNRQTSYRVGDYIAYEYGGTLFPETVILREEVTGRMGQELTIAVSVRRGTAEKRWIQVVTDTSENQRNNVTDALYEVVNDNSKRLENTHTEVLRLYEWVLPPSGKDHGKTREVKREVQLSPKVLIPVKCLVGLEEIDGRTVRREYCTSRHFLWTNISSTYTDTKNGEVLYYMKILTWGNSCAAYQA